MTENNKKDSKPNKNTSKNQGAGDVQTTQHQEEIELLNQKVNEFENNWKRALADYKNLQTRTEENRIQEIKYLKMSIINQLLPTIDHLEMHCKFSDDDAIEMIRKEFVVALEAMDVYEIKAEGVDFDAETMEAIDTVEGEKDKVLEVTRKGYILNNTVIRPAQVKVGNGK